MTDRIASLTHDEAVARAGLLPRPSSTQTLAQQTGWSAGGVNSHLTVLRQNGLVVPRREGRAVLHSRTATGDALARPS